MYREVYCCRIYIVSIGECNRVVCRRRCGCGKCSVAVVHDINRYSLAGCCGSIVCNTVNFSAFGYRIGIRSGSSESERTEGYCIRRIAYCAAHGSCFGCTVVCGYSDCIAPCCGTGKTVGYAHNLLYREAYRCRLYIICIGECCLNSVAAGYCAGIAG